MSSSSVTIGKLKLFGQLRENEERITIGNLHYIVAAWALEEYEALAHKPPATRVGNVMVQLTAE